MSRIQEEILYEEGVQYIHVKPGMTASFTERQDRVEQDSDHGWKLRPCHDRFAGLGLPLECCRWENLEIHDLTDNRRESMCYTKKCKYECWLGKCMVKADRIPDDALCMKEGESVKKPARGRRTKKAQ